jgi:zinc-ribbon domain
VSAPAASTSECPSCGAAVADEARFCAQCGTRLEPGATQTAAVALPDETGPVPVEVSRVEPHLFGITPPTTLLVLAAAALVAGIVLLLAEEPLPGAILIAIAGLLLVIFAGVAARKPDSRVARGAADALGRAGLLASSLSTRSGARRRLAALRAELDELERDRSSRLAELGAAVYGGDRTATKRVRSELERLDEAIGGKEAEMAAVVAETEESVRRARLQAQQTEMVELPEPPEPPEPQPGEADPPQPARIREPYPPPDEATPPEPPRIPEPEPPTEKSA